MQHLRCRRPRSRGRSKRRAKARASCISAGHQMPRPEPPRCMTLSPESEEDAHAGPSRGYRRASAKNLPRYHSRPLCRHAYRISPRCQRSRARVPRAASRRKGSTARVACANSGVAFRRPPHPQRLSGQICRARRVVRRRLAGRGCRRRRKRRGMRSDSGACSPSVLRVCDPSLCLGE